jgi:hypothetical protein
VEEREENPAQEDGTSNRLLSPTFIPPLTPTASRQVQERLLPVHGHYAVPKELAPSHEPRPSHPEDPPSIRSE